MKKENLLRMADYLEKNVTQEMFDMGCFRHGQVLEPECDSIGCIIGHCTILEEGELPRLQAILFDPWSVTFTGIDRNSDGWVYLFGGSWVHKDNTLKGAIKRIRYVVEFGFPDNVEDQLYGNAPLSYDI